MKYLFHKVKKEGVSLLGCLTIRERKKKKNYKWIYTYRKVRLACRVQLPTQAVAFPFPQMLSEMYEFYFH